MAFLSQGSAGPADMRRMRWFWAVRSLRVCISESLRSTAVAFWGLERVAMKSFGARMERLGSSRVR